MSLLGEYHPSIEERMLALAKKVAAHALARQAPVFKSLYGRLVRSSDPLLRLVQNN